ncbi:MAG: SPFH domain-containing protein [Candidatus Saccharimonas sp.]
MSVSLSKQPERPARTTQRTRRFRPVRTVVIALMSLFALIGLTACSKSAESGQMGIVVNGDLFPVDPEIIGCMQPETTEWHIMNDVYKYPARQISWDATGGSGSERGPYRVVSNASAPAELNVPVVVTFDLTRDCEQLKEFHRLLGTKYQAWQNDDGTSSEGWISLLNYVVGQQLEGTLVSVAQKYTWQQIWNDEAVRAEFEQALRTELPGKIKERSSGHEFFTNITVSVLKPEPADEGLKNAIAQQQASVAQADSARAAAEAQVVSAEAETRVAQQKALQKQAEISGFPTIDDYLRAQLIAAGGNPYQPTWIVPGTGGG